MFASWHKLPACAKADEISQNIQSKPAVIITMISCFALCLFGIFFGAEFALIVLILSFYYAVTSAMFFLVRLGGNMFARLKPST